MPSMKQFDKPFLSYDEMLDLLESRGLCIDDRDFAKSTLSNMSYYSIVNSYKQFSQVRGTDLFKEHLSFYELYTIHNVDVSLSNVLFKYILYIEEHLKSAVSYIVAKQFGVDENVYLDVKNYSSNAKSRTNTIKALKDVLDTNNTTIHRSNSFLHYQKNHNHIPPWILASTIVFGEAIMWYKILAPNEKDYVCNTFYLLLDDPPAESKEFLSKSLDLFRAYRNATAHRNKTFRFSAKIQLPKQTLINNAAGIVSKNEYESLHHARSGVWAIIAALCVLLNDKFLIGSLANDLANIFNPYIESNAIICGKTIQRIFCLPDDFLDRVYNFRTNLSVSSVFRTIS